MILRRLLITAFALVTLILVLGVTQLDIIITERLTQLPESFRYALTYVTEFGKSEYYLVPALVGALFFWWRAKQSTLLCQRVRHAYRASICVYLFACVSLAGLVGNLLKFLIGRSRPKEWLESGLYGLDPFTLASRWHSFPSGHANTMTAVVIALVPFIAPRYRMPLVVVAAVITATRCVVAAHYISDILGGALVAVIICRWLESYTRTHYRLPFALVKPMATAA